MMRNMKNIRIFLSENFPFLVVKFSIYLNKCVFVMAATKRIPVLQYSILYIILSLVIMKPFQEF